MAIFFEAPLERMVKKSCELCSAPARIYCEADLAVLCWDCDNAVHAANFLVARHSRNLLCQSCNSITEWRASGSELGRLVSACQRCDLEVQIGAKGGDYEEIDLQYNDDFGVTEDETDSSEEEEEEEVVSDDENRDNQVVPWSIAPPPWTFSSLSSEESTPESAILLSLKRKRGDSNDLAPPQDDLCDNISSNYGYASTMAEDWSSGGEDGAEAEEQCTSVDSLRPVKKDMKSGGDSPVQPQSVAASFRQAVAELGKGDDVGSSGSLSAVRFKMK